MNVGYGNTIKIIMKIRKQQEAFQMRLAKDYIIFPLDVPSLEKARPLVDLLAGHVGMFKVGLELFIKEGPEVIRMIKDAGDAGVFLDLKLHDIPETVRRAMAVVADLDVAFATVHCGESQKMLEAAVEGCAGKLGVLGVTVLTSVGSEEIRSAGFQEPFFQDMQTLVLKRAAMAKNAGCRGVVCSGHEAMAIKNEFGREFLTITPGIRPIWEPLGADDQKRVITPAQAIQNGSDYLVIGRPIRDAADPVKAAEKVALEIEETF